MFDKENSGEISRKMGLFDFLKKKEEEVKEVLPKKTVSKDGKPS